MIIQAFYYDPCICHNSVIINTDKGLFLLREGGIVYLSEFPPSTLELKLNEKCFFFHKKNDCPQKEHLSNLSSVYTSQLDTLFFFENGATIRLLHRNFCTLGLHYPLSKTPEPGPIFLSALESKKLGILENLISGSPFYSNVNIESRLFREPVEAAYIVYPGWLLLNESCFFSTLYLQEDTLSVDFVMNYIKPKMNPIQFSQFWQIPSLFSSFTHASFDHNTWDSYVKKDFLPEINIHTFSIQGKCIAEIVCVDTFCEPGYFPYHDSITLTLNYLKTYDSEVRKMILWLLNQYDNIIPVSPHFCASH